VSRPSWDFRRQGSPRGQPPRSKKTALIWKPDRFLANHNFFSCPCCWEQISNGVRHISEEPATRLAKISRKIGRIHWKLIHTSIVASVAPRARRPSSESGGARTGGLGPHHEA
jgi:hypothetical protein